MIFQDIYNSKIDQILKSVLETREEAESLKLARTVFPTVDVSQPWKADFHARSMLWSDLPYFRPTENQLWETWISCPKVGKVDLHFVEENLTVPFIPVVNESANLVIPNDLWYPNNVGISVNRRTSGWVLVGADWIELDTQLEKGFILSPQAKGYEFGHNVELVPNSSMYVLWRRLA